MVSSKVLRRPDDSALVSAPADGSDSFVVKLPSLAWPAAGPETLTVAVGSGRSLLGIGGLKGVEDPLHDDAADLTEQLLQIALEGESRLRTEGARQKWTRSLARARTEENKWPARGSREEARRLAASRAARVERATGILTWGEGVVTLISEDDRQRK